MKHSAGISISEKDIRAVLIDTEGRVVSRAGSELFHSEPGLIWQNVLSLLKELLSGDARGKEIVSCGAASPAGWLLAADSEGAPIFSFPPGRDESLKEEVRVVNEAADKLTSKTGVRFDTSSPLPRIIRFKKEHPDIYRKTRKFIPLAGFITGRLTGEYFTAAPSFGPGLGFDSISFRWHRFLKELGLLTETLPNMIDHGEKAGGVVSAEAVSAGLPRGTSVTAPASSDMCEFISSGASEPGRWNSRFGEKVVLNSIAPEIISSPSARILYRCFEQGSWTARAAIYAGESSLPEKFSGEAADGYYNTLEGCGLTVCPPADGPGGTLPFVPGEEQGFIIGKPRDNSELFSGYMQGLAYLERWTFEVLEELGFNTGGGVFATGKTHDKLLSLRAAVTEKKYFKPAEPTAEFGIAVAGLAKTAYGNIPEAARKTVKFSGVFEPPQSGDYRAGYRKFRRACRAIGYE